MKVYEKPKVIRKEFQLNGFLSTLSGWLDSSPGSDYQNAGITTYVLNS